MTKALTIVDATFNAGDSMSSVIDCTTLSPRYITIPTNWTPANISFQASNDNATFFDVMGVDGVETCIAAHAGTMIPVPGGNWSADTMWIKIRSGSREAPIVQEHDCAIQAVLS